MRGMILYSIKPRFIPILSAIIGNFITNEPWQRIETFQRTFNQKLPHLGDSVTRPSKGNTFFGNK